MGQCKFRCVKLYFLSIIIKLNITYGLKVIISCNSPSNRHCASLLLYCKGKSDEHTKPFKLNHVHVIVNWRFSWTNYTEW